MLIIGAKGHAKEIIDVLVKQDAARNLYLFDDVTPNVPEKLYGEFPVVRTHSEVEKIFSHDPYYVLGVGGCSVRKMLALKMKELGGILASIIANSANIGDYNVTLETGLNIMHNAFVSNDVRIGEGTLINVGCHIHHDVSIGKYCEISPGSIVTGGVQVGDNTFIGSGTIILPRIKIAENVVIGAGSIVTKDITEGNVVVVGSPAKIIKYISNS